MPEGDLRCIACLAAECYWLVHKYCLRLGHLVRCTGEKTSMQSYADCKAQPKT